MFTVFTANFDLFLCGGGSGKHGSGAQRDGGSAVAAAQRLRRWRQCNSAMSAAAAPSANALTHTPSNATGVLKYASPSLVEDGGTTALTAPSLSEVMASPAAMSTAVADAPPPPTMTPTVTLTSSFVLRNHYH